MSRFLLRLIGSVELLGFLGFALTHKPSEVPSAWIDNPAPAFTLPQFANQAETFSPDAMKGKVWLMNVWASWCLPCLEEHPVIRELTTEHGVPVVGLNYKDIRNEAISWLNRHGDSYLVSVSDTQGRGGSDYGVYGVPETFLIDQAGVLRYNLIGSHTHDAVRDTILPMIRELEK